MNFGFANVFTFPTKTRTKLRPDMISIYLKFIFSTTIEMDETNKPIDLGCSDVTLTNVTNKLTLTFVWCFEILTEIVFRSVSFCFHISQPAT